MGKAPIPTIVGGGIALVPGVVGQIGQFFFVSSIIPPEGTTSDRWRIAGVAPNQTLIAETAAGRGNTVIGPGSTGSATNNPEVLIGSSVTSVAAGTPSGNIGIGANIGFTAASQNAVIIGEQPAGQFPVGGTTGGSLTIINRINSLGGAFRNAVTSVGAGNTLSASTIVAIGNSISISGANSVVVGDSGTSSAADNVVIGVGAGAAGANSVIVGRASTGTGTTTNLVALGGSIAVPNLSNVVILGNGASVSGLATGDVVIGNNNLGGGGFSSRVVWGGANLHTNLTAVPAWTFRHKNAQGADTAAGSVTFIAPLATGNAVGGSFVFQTGPAGASGAALQAATTRLTISPNGVTTLAAPTAAAENLVITGFGGAGQASIRLDGLTNGAGALAGTLNNSPVAGDPTFWVPVNIAGAVKFMPAW